MAKYHYQLLIDSKTGKLLSQFWHACIKCEQEAEKYAKKMGGLYYYPDTRYFTGGVSFISFPDNKPSDPQMWREVGVQHKDGSFTEARSKDYKGAQQPGDVVYFEPNVSKRIEWIEIPTKESRPADTFDCIHSAIPPIERDGKWWIQCCHFIYDEPPGRSGNNLRVASRTVRRAIKAEVKRTKLPVMRVEALLNLLGAELFQKADGGANGRGTTVNSTPTFFAFEGRYYIGCDYECKADGLVAISAQTHKTYQDRFVIASRRKAD